MLRTSVASVSRFQQEQGGTAIIAGNSVSSSSYNGYTSSEVPLDMTKQNDGPDYYRNSDQCLKNGSISSSHCASISLDCNFVGQFGQAKLCMNRLPTSKGKWFVAALKCIPVWENCDKCMCGFISSEGPDATCTFENQTPDDDVTQVTCTDLSSATIDGTSFDIPSSGGSSSTTSSTATSGPPPPAAMSSEQSTSVSSGSSSKAIWLSIAGLVAGIAFLALVTVKIIQRRRDAAYTEHQEEDELNLEEKETSSENGSSDSSEEKHTI